jgi:hypothetical protein
MTIVQRSVSLPPHNLASVDLSNKSTAGIVFAKKSKSTKKSSLSMEAKKNLN